jgi:NAD(P)-dependent dehydrogenase (short-subunit alcohol dehydrogenase family)
VNVFITGASSGIGAALALHYAREGATLGLYARRAHELTHLAATLPSARCAVYVGDVRDADALRDAATDYVARFGVPDVVIASAGVSLGTSSARSEDNEAFRTVFETNVLGMLFTFQPFLEPMQAARKGTLVGIASVAGFRGLPGSGPYSASKAAAISYLESLRVEMRGKGIAVVTICPGYIDTPMTARNPYPMPFLLKPDRAAKLIARAVAGGRRFYVLPWQMAWIGKLLRVMPRPLYDMVFARAPHKPRSSP